MSSAAVGQRDPVVRVRISRRLVEHAVVNSVALVHELRLDGARITYAEMGRADTIVVTLLQTLVHDALDLLSLKDDAADLSKLEAALESALACVRGFRQERAP